MIDEEDENLQQQQDEVFALVSIFGEECVLEVDRDIRIGIPSLKASPHLLLLVSFPNEYPSRCPPVFELQCDVLDASTITEMATYMETHLFQPGEVVLFRWVEWLQEEWEPPPPPSALEPDSTPELATKCDDEEDLTSELQSLSNLHISHQKMKKEATTEIDDENPSNVVIIHGEPLTERKSTFQAHIAAVTDVADVTAVMDTLLSNNKIRAASHNMLAYRIEGAREGTFIQDCDDDGEAAAGGRLLHLLQMMDARNVVVVVSRWFGGILLGPARFGLINKVARELLENEGFLSRSRNSSSGKKISKT